MEVRGREGKGVRDGKEKLGCYVYCWQFTHAHSIWDPISCQIGKAMGMWDERASQQGLNLAHHWDLIKTQSRRLPEQTHRGPHPNTHSLHLHSRPSKLLPLPLFLTQTLQRKMYTWSCTHPQKNINLQSHMGTHILSHAITLRPILKYPLLQGREMMYETAQLNTGSYLLLWPVTWVYLHYAVVHFKSFTSVGGYWYGRRRQELWLHIEISPNASSSAFSLPP